MHSFSFYSPTKIIFGEGAAAQTADQIAAFEPKRVLLVYGSDRILTNGLYDQLAKSIQEKGIALERFGGIKPNPTLKRAYEGVEFAREKQIDFVLAVGGGSVIDTAKGIAHGCANPGTDIWKDFWLGGGKLEKTLPIGVVLTIPAAGSESSNSAVLTNTETGEKRGLSTDLNRPKFAIMDPTLTYTLPKYQVGCGVTDIMMHTMERYFNPLENELTDAIAEALLRTVIHYGKTALADPSNYEAMSEIMWAGSLSHNGLTGLGGIPDFATHQLGHQISARFDMAHGASLAIMWASWARYVCPVKPERFARFARKVWGIEEADTQAAAAAGIAATEAYFKEMGMPICFSDAVGVQTPEVIEEMARRCVWDGKRTIGSFQKLGMEEVHKIFQAANH